MPGTKDGYLLSLCLRVYNLDQLLGKILRPLSVDREAFVLELFFKRSLERHRRVYQIGVNGNDETRGWRVNDYFLRVLFRGNFYRKWLYYDIQPELVFSREEDFEADPRLILRLEAFFGQEYL